MTSTSARIDNSLLEPTVVDDYRRKGCNCTHCKGSAGNPNETHGSGAPIVKHPTTRKDVTYRRPSSLGKPLEDTYHLDLWSKRMVAVGVANTKALAAKIANLDPNKADDKKILNDLASEAITHAKGDEASDLGTEMHRVVERLNRGLITIDDVPEVFKADAEAYLAELERHGLVSDPAMVERFAVNDHVRAAGRFDMVLNEYLSDLKTGQSIDLAQVGIAVQLATYRNSFLYDVTTDERSSMPTLDSDVALVVHLPFGQATCRIVEVDIRKGWQAAELAAEAKSWNHRKDLFKVREIEAGSEAEGTSSEPHGTVADPARHAWLLERVTTISAHDEKARVRLAALWMATGVATFKAARENGYTHSNEELGGIAKLCEQVEAEFSIPFGPSDPTMAAAPKKLQRPKLDEGADVSANDVKAVRMAIAELDVVAKDAVNRWAEQAIAAKCSFSLKDKATERRAAIVTAAIALASWEPTDDARSAIDVVLGQETQMAISTGALLGQLTIDEAKRLSEVVAALVADTGAIRFDRSGKPTLAVA